VLLHELLQHKARDARQSSMFRKQLLLAVRAEKLIRGSADECMLAEVWVHAV
jgi:hypothetical protein